MRVEIKSFVTNRCWRDQLGLSGLRVSWTRDSGLDFVASDVALPLVILNFA